MCIVPRFHSTTPDAQLDSSREQLKWKIRLPHLLDGTVSPDRPVSKIDEKTKQNKTNIFYFKLSTFISEVY